MAVLNEKQRSRSTRPGDSCCWQLGPCAHVWFTHPKAESIEFGKDTRKLAHLPRAVTSLLVTVFRESTRVAMLNLKFSWPHISAFRKYIDRCPRIPGPFAVT